MFFIHFLTLKFLIYEKFDFLKRFPELFWENSTILTFKCKSLTSKNINE